MTDGPRAPQQRQPLCWVVTDGRAGMENQALGLAEAVARLTPLDISVKRIKIRKPWRRTPRLFWPDPFSLLSREGHLLRPPYPDLWIACGRVTVALTIAVKRRNRPTFTIQTQDPRAPARLFDLVVPPEHDRLNGENIFPILGAPGRVTSEKIAAAAVALAPAFESLARPRVAALIGGPNKTYRMDDARIEWIGEALARIAGAGAGVIVAPSRRTGAARIAKLKAALSGAPVFFVEPGAEPGGRKDAYLGALGLADHILVTADSVNMACEAAATGKPVHVLPLDGRGGKFERFHAALEACGAARPYSGRLETWSYAPLDETARAAGEILRRWRPPDV
ncbi:MAG: mitochondrial fission ELM1 family protein [Parvularculaceae bacterium]